MRQTRGHRFAASVIAALALLAGCSASAGSGFDFPLGGSYAQTNYVALADLGEVVVAPNGNTVYGFESGSEPKWSVTLQDTATCQKAGNYALCLAGEGAVLFDGSGQSKQLPRIIVEGEADGRVYYAKAAGDLIELTEQEAAAPLAEFGEGGDVVARLDDAGAKLPDGTTVAAAAGKYPEKLQALLDAGVLDLGSPWLNPPGIANVAQPLKDGFVVQEPGQITVDSVAPTKVTVLDAAGEEVKKAEVAPSLHMSVNAQWTVADYLKIIDQVQQLSTAHAFVFEDGQVVGFDRVLTDGVAPAYANIAALQVGDNKTDLGDVTPESLGFWAVTYPYVSVYGINDDGVVAKTFNVETGKVLVSDAKCQWTDEAFCFTDSKLFKPDFAK